MAFLLDALHEDLNRVKKKEYVPISDDCDDPNVPEHIVANEAWERYLKRDDSKVVDLFQGQYKSK